jgi:hypothetical protein
MVAFVRGSIFAGEDFHGLSDAQRRRAEAWCADRAGQRIHRTTRCRPGELFAAEEAPPLLTVPVMPYDLPVYATAKVHRDHHIEVATAPYWVPGALTCRTRPLPTPCVTSATCSARPTTPALRSAPTPRRCSRTRCPGPGCGRSTRCSAWSANDSSRDAWIVRRDLQCP